MAVLRPRRPLANSSSSSSSSSSFTSSHSASSPPSPTKVNFFNLIQLIQDLLVNPRNTLKVGSLVILAEVFVCWFIIFNVKYTEIDWSTYMQQVQCFLNHTLDYSQISGNTGPIVYPAGHLYMYTLFYWLTDQGVNIFRAQCLFALIYIINLILIIRILNRIQLLPPFVLVFMCFTSYRVHSIYMLRLFNDPLAMLGLYLAINLFLSGHWLIGCIVYSLAVSIKMNVLLFAPALLLLLFEHQSNGRAFASLTVCVLVQLLIGLPFLLFHPLAYLTRSFELGRVFLFKWTVNFRFLPETLFLDRKFHLALLTLHLIVLVAFFFSRILAVLKKIFSGSKVLATLLDSVNKKTVTTTTNKSTTVRTQEKKKKKESNLSLSTSADVWIVYTLFVSNFIGVCFARSLHYQFYVWYFHQLPFLLWTIPLPYNWIRLCILAVIELCWNTYPSTVWSSLTLQAMHLIILLSLIYHHHHHYQHRHLDRIGHH